MLVDLALGIRLLDRILRAVALMDEPSAQDDLVGASDAALPRFAVGRTVPSADKETHVGNRCVAKPTIIPSAAPGSIISR